MNFQKLIAMAFGIFLPVSAGAAPSPATIPKNPGPGWSKKGTAFWMHCFNDEKPAPDCRSRRIVSPDGNSSVEVIYRHLPPSKKKNEPEFSDDKFAYLRVVSLDQPPRVIFADSTELGGPDGEIIWAPNSRAFLINTHLGAAYDYIVRVYSLDDPNLTAVDPTKAAVKELAFSLKPWCLKSTPRPFDVDCMPFLRDPDSFDITAVDWLPDSSGIAVSAEVVPSSGFGLIMGQSRGYEIGVLGHYFLRALTAEEFKARWQGSATWNIQIPDTLEQALRDNPALGRKSRR